MKFLIIFGYSWVGTVLSEEFNTKHQSNVSEIHSTPLIVLVNSISSGGVTIPLRDLYAHSNKSTFQWWIHCSTTYVFECLYVKLAMDSIEHRINWRWLDISWSFETFFFKSNVVEIVHKMSTLHIHICRPDCIHAFTLLIL